MEYEVIISHRARIDLDIAIEWYNIQKHDLGIDFLLDFYLSMDFISSFPKLNPIFNKNYRRYLFERFPYAIFYEVDDRFAEITVLAIWDTRRNPEDLMSRLS